MPEFLFDVAFSFLAEDEGTAVALHEKVSPRLKAFIYSDEQRRLAGRDGEETFNRVYGVESRVVVILYRKAWGDTPFTRFEATAIRNRGFAEGYDFTILIPMDTPPEAPPWFPKNRLWVGLDRWGFDAAAAVIEARVQERNGEPREETAIERAASLKRDEDFKQQRDRFLSSESGVAGAKELFALLVVKIKEVAQRIATSSYALRVNEGEPWAVLIQGFRGATLRVEWYCRFANTLSESQLLATVWKSGRRQNPTEIGREAFAFDVIASGEWAWADDSTRTFSSEALADHLLKEYFRLASEGAD